MYYFSGSVVFSPIKPVRFAIIIFADVCKRREVEAARLFHTYYCDVIYLFVLHPTHIMSLLELPVSL